MRIMIRCKTVVSCDICGKEMTFKGFYGKLRPLEPYLKKQGWRVGHCEKTICPECIELEEHLKTRPEGTV